MTDRRPPPTPVPSGGISYRHKSDLSELFLVMLCVMSAFVVVVSTLYGWRAFADDVASKVERRLAERIDPHCFRVPEPDIPHGTTEPR